MVPIVDEIFKIKTGQIIKLFTKTDDKILVEIINETITYNYNRV